MNAHGSVIETSDTDVHPCIARLAGLLTLLTDPISTGTKLVGMWMLLSKRISFPTLRGPIAACVFSPCSHVFASFKQKVPIMADNWGVVYEVCHGTPWGTSWDIP